jgi:hypothetical protein
MQTHSQETGQYQCSGGIVADQVAKPTKSSSRKYSLPSRLGTSQAEEQGIVRIHSPA